MAVFQETAINDSKEKKGTVCLNGFKSISLGEMDEVKLLNRFDSKYWFDAKKLHKILKAIKDDYFVLEIDGTKIQPYSTIYFDTPSNYFYVSHHNGKSNRLKIRKRKYVMSGISFLEIKKKDNKGKTDKIRMPICNFQDGLSDEEKDFIAKNTHIDTESLEIKFGNRFKRITLVNRDFNERCTIDTNLCFYSPDSGGRAINNLVIVELKQDCRNMKSKIAEVLKENKIYKNGFSKYCMGRALNETSLKKNWFKADILKLEKQLYIQ